jgi:hypothetical protein
MPITREVSSIQHPQGLVLFQDGMTGQIMQWMDQEGGFHDEWVPRPLAVIVRDPVHGYHTLDLRTCDHPLN